MANTATNVSVGKPATGGAIFRAPLGSTLPTSASGTLDNAFKSLGYISDAGLKNNNSPETSEVKAWGGNTVMTMLTAKPDTFAFELIEVLNADVLKAVYGDANVSGTLPTGITVKANATQPESGAWVCEMIMTNGAVKRIVIPNASITSVGEIAYTDEEAVGYEITITALPDAQGNTHYEYITRADA